MHSMAASFSWRRRSLISNYSDRAWGPSFCILEGCGVRIAWDVGAVEWSLGARQAGGKFTLATGSSTPGPSRDAASLGRCSLDNGYCNDILRPEPAFPLASSRFPLGDYRPNLIGCDLMTLLGLGSLTRGLGNASPEQAWCIS